MNIFVFTEYKAYLRAQITSHSTIHGYQAKCADAAGCQRAYLSQVLHKEVHLTPDHAARLSQFWNLDDDASDYFLLLLQRERAASQELRARSEKKISSLRAKHLNLSKRFNQPELTSSDRAARYYSHWSVAAVHLILGIPEYAASLEKIARRLGLSLAQTRQTVRELESLQMIERKDRIWKVLSPSIHVSRESPLNLIHQSNWRLRAVDSVARKNVENIHYSGLYVLNKADGNRLQKMALEFIEATRGVVGPSNEEDLVCLNLDLFQV